MIDLKDIVGQNEAVARLTATVCGSRQPHAYIFAGRRGVGRRTTAIALARAVLCEKRKASSADACGACDSCRLVDAGSHPDLHLVYKELAAYHDDSNVRSRMMQDLGIDVIRTFLIAPAYRSAAHGHGKVFIVSESELMSNAAQNALLKTLEEPPEGVTILLLCSRPEQMLPTTLSRCAMVRFGLLPADFVIERLTTEGISPVEAAYWAALTGGSLGESAEMAARGLYQIKCELLERLASMGPAGDAKLPEYLIKTTESLAKAAVSEAKKIDGPEMSMTLANRRATAAMLSVLVSAYRDALAESAGHDGPRINADQLPQVQSLAGRFSAEGLCEVIDQLGRYEQLLWRNVSAKTIWDNVAITCATGALL